MKRKALVILLAMSMAGLTACGSSGSSTSTGSTAGDTAAKTEAAATEAAETKAEENIADGFTVTFDYNYEEAPEAYTETVEAENAAAAPEEPVRSGYAFTGWYTDAETTQAVDFEVAITENTTYYAGWEKTAVSVTFDPNYEGGEAAVSEVEAGGTVSTPETPTREGYIFNGWYTDADATTAFDFSAAVSDDLTLYAGWEESDGDTLTVTYMWNIDDKGQYDAVAVKNYGYAQKPELTLDGYYLEGWYTDEACTEKFDFAATRVREDVTLYAHWLHEYVFEAEYTDMTGLEGMGYSGNASGTKMIEDGTDRGASEGNYVGWLYNEGLTLTFNVTSDAATEDALLALSLSAEYYDITLTDDNFTVSVNGTKVEYEDISFTGTAEMELPFATYVLESNVALQEGDNVITLSVTNSEKKTGTIYATAPLVDCLYVYSDTSVDWAEGFPLTDNVK